MEIFKFFFFILFFFRKNFFNHIFFSEMWNVDVVVSSFVRKNLAILFYIFLLF